MSMSDALAVVRFCLAAEDAAAGSLTGMHCDSNTCKAFFNFVAFVRNAGTSSIDVGNWMCSSLVIKYMPSACNCNK